MKRTVLLTLALLFATLGLSGCIQIQDYDGKVVVIDKQYAKPGKRWKEGDPPVGDGNMGHSKYRGPQHILWMDPTGHDAHEYALNVPKEFYDSVQVGDELHLVWTEETRNISK